MIGHAAPCARPPVPRATNASILVVEDEPLIRALICEVLDERAYAVRGAPDAEAALAAVAQGPLDLAIVDLGLPGGMSGLRFAERLGDLRPRTAVLFISGHAEPIELRGAPAAALAKPFTMQALLTRVAELLGSARGTCPAPA